MGETRAYLQMVQSAYSAQNIPEDTRLKYSSALKDFRKRMPAHNKALGAFNSDLQEYQRRVTAFNARVGRYNTNR